LQGRQIRPTKGGILDETVKKQFEFKLKGQKLTPFQRFNE